MRLDVIFREVGNHAIGSQIQEGKIEKKIISAVYYVYLSSHILPQGPNCFMNSGTSKTQGSLLTFGKDHVFAESLLRGFKLQLFTHNDYTIMSQCNGMDDIRTYLQSTSYGSVFDGELTVQDTSTIAKICTSKLVQEFEYLRSNSTEPLTSFLEYIRIAYIIDNVIFMIAGTLRRRGLQTLTEKCHLLGMFEGIQSLTVEQSLSNLYHLILVETPLAPYFKECLSFEDLDELNIEIIRNIIYKAYLEDFHSFCMKLGGDTADIMDNLLSFQADRRTINITLNSIQSDLGPEDRFKLYPALGSFHPYGVNVLKNVDSFEKLEDAIQNYPVYPELFNMLKVNDDYTLEDVFLKHEVKLHQFTFNRFSNFAPFYSYFRLKEQEIRNIVWISECILQNQKNKISSSIFID